MSVSYIIDGYNLLHAMGAIKGKLGPGGLEQARARLLGLLAGSLGDAASAVTVVFDASSAPPGATGEQQHGRINVRFAIGVEQADDLIEDLIRHHSAPKNLIVVSDDHRLQTAARHRAAAAWDTATFLSSLNEQRRQKPRPAQPEKPTSADHQAWLKEFEDLEKDPKLREFFDNF